MKRASFADMHCSVAQALEVIGEWWTLLILRDAFFGVTRFEQFADRLGIARNILTARLESLVANGILTRRCYDDARNRFDYVLTDKGRALWPVLVAVKQWGDEWLLGEGNEPVTLVHKRCGAVTRATFVCSECGERLEQRDLRSIPGPGAVDPDLIPARSEDVDGS